MKPKRMNMPVRVRLGVEAEVAQSCQQGCRIPVGGGCRPNSIEAPDQIIDDRKTSGVVQPTLAFGSKSRSCDDQFLEGEMALDIDRKPLAGCPRHCPLTVVDLGFDASKRIVNPVVFVIDPCGACKVARKDGFRMQARGLHLVSLRTHRTGPRAPADGQARAA